MKIYIINVFIDFIYLQVHAFISIECYLKM